MFNRGVIKPSIVKSVDKFILPFVLLIATRYLGVFVAAFFSPLQFKVGLESDLLSVPFIQFPEVASLILANSVSWILTGGVIGIVFGFIAFRSTHLSEDLLHPKQAATFHGKKMEHFIVDSHEAFHQSISWVVVTLIALALVTADFLFGNLLAFAFGVIISMTALLSVLFTLSIVRNGSLEGEKV